MRTLIAVGVTLWSLASGGSGLATSFAMLLITRCFVGIGEAAYGPVALVWNSCSSKTVRGNGCNVSSVA